MLLASDIRVSFGRRPILHGVELSARPGEVTAIIGPNGSGKTTLMRALTGEIGYGGTATLNGLNIARAPAWALASMRGVLPQSATLSFPFTVHEVVRLGTLAGLSDGDDDLRERIEEALGLVDLSGFGRRFYQELSGGEQQRVQLARVLCQVWEPLHEDVPRYLFLDEPVSSLDIKHQLHIMQIAARYAQAGGGVLAIMHDLNLTAHFADQIVLMSEGRVHAHGTPGTVMTEEHLQAVYGCPMSITPNAGGMDFLVLPRMDAQAGTFTASAQPTPSGPAHVSSEHG